MLDRKDKAILAQAAVYAALAIVAWVALLFAALAAGEAVHLFRAAAGV